MDFPKISEIWDNCRKITDEFRGFSIFSPPFLISKQRCDALQILVGRGTSTNDEYSLRIDSRFEKKNVLFSNRPSKQWDSSEDWTRISMRIGEKKRFARIWPSASKIVFFARTDSRELIRANLRNIGMRVACPLSFQTLLTFSNGIFWFCSVCQPSRHFQHIFWRVQKHLQSLGERSKQDIPLSFETKNQPRGSFWDGHPANIRGSFMRISRSKTSVSALKKP